LRSRGGDGVSAGGEPIWVPTPDDLAAAHVSRFARWLSQDGRARLTGDYLELWRWSVDQLDEFWMAVWDYFGVRAATPYLRVRSGSVMPDVQWFTGAQVSYVEHLFRGRDPERVALIDARESTRPGAGPVSRLLTWGTYPGVWRHGDWITITDRCSVVVHGRSDATLNRHGIRMGSSDIYHVVEQLDEIAEALVVGVERPEGDYWMPLFVVLNPGHELGDALTARIQQAIREGASPRHVPDEIIAAPAIPHTRTGKKLEIPVKRILQGGDPGQVMEAGAVDNPDALQWFAAYQTRTFR